MDVSNLTRKSLQMFKLGAATTNVTPKLKRSVKASRVPLAGDDVPKSRRNIASEIFRVIQSSVDGSF